MLGSREKSPFRMEWNDQGARLVYARSDTMEVNGWVNLD